MNDPTFGIKWNVTRLTDLDFADDLALLGDSVESLQAMTNNLASTAAKVGLKISTAKTKIISVTEDHPITVQVNNQNAEEVESLLRQQHLQQRKHRIRHFQQAGQSKLSLPKASFNLDVGAHQPKKQDHLIQLTCHTSSHLYQ